MLFATAEASNVGRSQSLQIFHGSEVAFWNNAEDHLASIFMALSNEDNIEIILESTSNGQSGIFYELCSEAILNKNDFKLIFIPWFWHEEYRLEVSNDWKPSIAWLEYGNEYNLNINQIYWAYLKNEILSRITGEDKNNGPSIYFKREFPANVSEAFVKNENNYLITFSNVKTKAISKQELMNNSEFLHIKQKFIQQKRLSIILGVDVARGGGDYSWIIDKQGDFLGFNVNEKIDLSDTMKVAYWILNYIQKFNPYKVFIDAGGGGIAVYDRLIELGQKGIVEPVYFASSPSDVRKFLNKRAEMWFLLKEFILNNGYIINDNDLIKQIISVKYKYNLKGQLQLEAKKNIHGRLKSSPDGGDAAALTFSNSIIHKKFTITTSNNTNQNYFDPYSW